MTTYHRFLLAFGVSAILLLTMFSARIANAEVTCGVFEEGANTRRVCSCDRAVAGECSRMEKEICKHGDTNCADGICVCESIENVRLDNDRRIAVPADYNAPDSGATPKSITMRECLDRKAGCFVDIGSACGSQLQCVCGPGHPGAAPITKKCVDVSADSKLLNVPRNETEPSIVNTPTETGGKSPALLPPKGDADIDAQMGLELQGPGIKQPGPGNKGPSPAMGPKTAPAAHIQGSQIKGQLKTHIAPQKDVEIAPPSGGHGKSMDMGAHTKPAPKATIDTSRTTPPRIEVETTESNDQSVAPSGIEHTPKNLPQKSRRVREATPSTSTPAVRTR